MIALRLAPLFLALVVLSGCGSKDAASGGAVTKVEGIKAVPAPAGTNWADHVVETAEGVRMGNPDAPIKLIEYGSYTCPHCRDFAKESHEAIEKDYVNSGKVSFEYRNMLRDSLDLTVALIAHCGGAEPYFPLSIAFFGNQEDMIKNVQAAGDNAFKEAASAPVDLRFVKIARVAGLIEFAKQHGLPEEKVHACLANTATPEKLTKISQDVVEKNPSFPGTPTFFINGTMLDNTATWEALEPKLHEAGA